MTKQSWAGRCRGQVPWQEGHSGAGPPHLGGWWRGLALSPRSPTLLNEGEATWFVHSEASSSRCVRNGWDRDSESLRKDGSPASTGRRHQPASENEQTGNKH